VARPVWFVWLLRKVYPYRAVAAWATRLPVAGRLVEHLLFEGDRLVYLPGTRAIAIDEAVDPPGDMVLPAQVVEHFIRQARHHWIMDACICRQASHCQDYPIDLGCLFLGEATLGINPELGRPVSEAEALAHVRRAQEAGLVHLVGRNKLDTVWLGVGPGHKLLTICNCCPCCCLWGSIPHLAPHIAAKVQRMPGVTVTVGDSCVGCGTCAAGVCFVDAIRLRDGRAVISEECRGCGRCVAACPQGAIRLSIEGSHSLQQAVEQIASVIDLS
jgi:ferredoxin